MWASMDIDSTGVQVDLRSDSQGRAGIRITYGALMIRLNVAEAVDLVDKVVRRSPVKPHSLHNLNWPINRQNWVSPLCCTLLRTPAHS